MHKHVATILIMPCTSDMAARGIEFRFESFDEFFAEVGRRPTPKHSLDRIKNNGHYEKGNVHWEQSKPVINEIIA